MRRPFGIVRASVFFPFFLHWRILITPCFFFLVRYEKDEDSLSDYHAFYAWKQEVINMTAVCRRQLENFSSGVGDGLTEDRF